MQMFRQTWKKKLHSNKQLKCAIGRVFCLLVKDLVRLKQESVDKNNCRNVF